MSSSMALRRSPKPGALTAATLMVPRSLFTTRVARASPSTSSAMMRSGLPVLATLLEHGEQVLEGADFLLVDEDVGVVEDALPSTPRWSRSRARGSPCRTACLRRRRGWFRSTWLLLDRDGAVLADLVHRVGDDLADRGVPVGGDGGDLRDLGAVLDLLRDVRELGDDGFDGLVDAALERGRVGTGGDVLEAFA